MAHELEFDKNGNAKMAYANEVPWHRLGVSMGGLQTADAMLAAAQADFDVVLTKVAAVDNDGNIILNPDGTPVLIEDSRATIRSNPDGTFDGLATVGTRFTIEQNRECLHRALDIVAASSGSAVVDTCGVLHGGREFFACLDLGALVIDPVGINDKIERYLLVRNGHDGKTPITFANTPIRAVCKNTVIMGMKSARNTFTAKHTRNSDKAVETARSALNISVAWAENFKSEAERLLRVPVPAGSRQFDKVFDAVFPLASDATDRQRKYHENIQMTVRALYGSAKNAAGYGHNGWSTYNAIAEYFDHHREASAEERALASMDFTSWVTKKKQIAQETILTLV
jgi:phage/plasmid-like protein (TIGR03299 family)